MKLTLFRASNGMFGFYIVNIVYKSETFLFNHENMSISSPKLSRGKTIRSETANVRFDWNGKRTFWNVKRAFWNVKRTFWNVKRAFWNVKRAFWNVKRAFWNVKRAFWNVKRTFWNVKRAFWNVKRAFWNVKRAFWNVKRAFWNVKRAFWNVKRAFWNVKRTFWNVKRTFWNVKRAFWNVKRAFWNVKRAFWNRTPQAWMQIAISIDEQWSERTRNSFLLTSRIDDESQNNVPGYTGCIKKKVIELCSALARLLYNLQKSFFRRWIDQAFSFWLSSFLWNLKKDWANTNQMKIAGPNRIFPPLSIIRAANRKRKFH